MESEDIIKNQVVNDNGKLQYFQQNKSYKMTTFKIYKNCKTYLSKTFIFTISMSTKYIKLRWYYKKKTKNVIICILAM